MQGVTFRLRLQKFNQWYILLNYSIDILTLKKLFDDFKTYAQSVVFCGDETTHLISKTDRYLSNQDIAGLFGSLIYEDVKAVLKNQEEVELIFQKENNKRVAATILQSHWN